MDNRDKKQKKQMKANIRPILFLLAGLTVFSAIIYITVLEASKDIKPTLKAASNIAVTTAPDNNKTSALSSLIDCEMLAVVKEIKEEEQKATLFNINTGETTVLTYNGGTDITDKYGQAVTISKIPAGTIVNAGYHKEDNSLLKMQTSDKAWKYTGVKNLSVDTSNHIMKIADTKYQYTDDVILLDGGVLKTVEDLAGQDELTVWGVNETIWSVTVTKGHGSVKLIDCDDYLGGNVTIGYEALQQISEGMVIKVREGNFNLTAENGQYSGTKNITVYRNEETVVSLSNLGPDALKRSSITFEITPFGADLYIDGKLTNYADPIELSYGKHSIEVSLGGYTTYKGIINVDTAGKKVKIDLPESQSSDNISVAESGYDNTGNTSADEYNDWDETSSADTVKSGDSSDSNSGDTANSKDTSDSSIDTAEDGTKDETSTSGTDSKKSDTLDNEKETIDKNHSVYVQNPAGASVYIDGKYMGTSPGHFKKIIGNHVITFIKDGYQTKSYSIEILDDGMDTYYSLPDLKAIK